MSAYSPLSRDDERALLARAKAGDQRSADRLIEAFNPLVKRQVFKLVRFGVDTQDLEQEGRMGLMRAIENFDAENFENRFGVYATWWVRTFVEQYMIRNWTIITIKSGGKEKWKGLAKFAATHGRPQSIDDPEGASLVTALPDRSPSPEEALGDLQVELLGARRIDRLMTILDARERKIINQRWLKEDGDTLEILSIELGITRERVRQIEQKALRKMRYAAAS